VLVPDAVELRYLLGREEFEVYTTRASWNW
jgi:hypothetical protein